MNLKNGDEYKEQREQIQIQKYHTMITYNAWDLTTIKIQTAEAKVIFERYLHKWQNFQIHK